MTAIFVLITSIIFFFYQNKVFKTIENYTAQHIKKHNEKNVFPYFKLFFVETHWNHYVEFFNTKYTA